MQPIHMKKVRVNIFVGDRYYHTLTIPSWFFDPIKEKEIKDYIENKLPSLKSKKWRIEK